MNGIPVLRFMKADDILVHILATSQNVRLAVLSAVAHTQYTEDERYVTTPQPVNDMC